MVMPESSEKGTPRFKRNRSWFIMVPINPFAYSRFETTNKRKVHQIIINESPDLTLPNRRRSLTFLRDKVPVSDPCRNRDLAIVKFGLKMPQMTREKNAMSMQSYAR